MPCGNTVRTTQSSNEYAYFPVPASNGAHAVRESSGKDCPRREKGRFKCNLNQLRLDCQWLMRNGRTVVHRFARLSFFGKNLLLISGQNSLKRDDPPSMARLVIQRPKVLLKVRSW